MIRVWRWDYSAWSVHTAWWDRRGLYVRVGKWRLWLGPKAGTPWHGR